MTTYLGWIASLCLIIGVASIDKARRWPFVFIGAGEIAWLAVAVLTESSALVFNSLVFLALDVRNFVKWGRQL